MNVNANLTNYSCVRQCNTYSKNNVNFGMKIVPETKFLENILNMRKVPSLPNANGGNMIAETMSKISKIIAKANDEKLLDKNLETKSGSRGLDINDLMPNYKNLEAQLRFMAKDDKLVIKMSSEPVATNGLPSRATGKLLAECYAPQNFGQNGTSASVIIDELGEKWARNLPENTNAVEKALLTLINKFSDTAIANFQKFNK